MYRTKKKNKAKNIFNIILKDIGIRRAVVAKRFEFFFLIYFHKRFEFETPPFHEEIISILENNKNKFAVILAFRGSAKSTLISVAYVLWSIFGVQQKKFVILVGQTEQKARAYLMNVRRELENNELLRKDLGPFEEERGPWGATALVIKKLNAKIMIASIEQSIRGILHDEHRPDLVILDDVEDIESVKTQERRDNLYNWFTGEVIPAGSKKTHFIIIGNLLHEDSLIRRLQKKIESSEIDGIFREYPIMDENGNPLWPGKYPTPKDIEDEKRKIINLVAWTREFMLKIIPDEDQIIQPDWISKYDILPDKELRMIAISVDLAISEKETADYTAIIVSRLYDYGDKAEIYIHPNPINKRMSFPETVKILKDLYFSLRGGDHETIIFIEDVAYQRSIIQELKRQGVNVEGVLIGGNDKRARLNLASQFIHEKRIHFPLRGAEKIIEQIVGFGVEKHDDLADAFTLGVLKMQEIISRPKPSITWI